MNFLDAAYQVLKQANKPLHYNDGENLIKLLIKHEIGVVTERHTVHTLDEEW
jgi:restriction endonuclease Mrr